MAAVGRRDSFLNNIIPLCAFLMITTISASGSKAISNVLSTGQTLRRGEELGYPNGKVSLVLTPDCNVILYDGRTIVWASRTGGIHGNCTLSLSNNGRLFLNFTNGHQLWITRNRNAEVGKYVAVVLPEAVLAIYGPGIWAVGVPIVKENSIDINSNSDIDNNEMVSSMTNLKNRQAIHNVLFSGQILYNGGNIYENGYTFILDDCELILKDSRGTNTWQTFTHGYGINCFARLDYHGVLAIFDENHALVWTNEPEIALPPPYGNYVLVVQSDGTATIYRPRVWSSLERDNLIKMLTVEM